MSEPKPVQKQPLKDPAYYLTLFTLEGHRTWRAHLGGHADDFENQLQPSTPKITDKKVLRIDRLTGTFSEAK